MAEYDEKAMDDDAARRDAVARQRAKNMPPATIPVPPERMAKIQQAQQLRTQLGGYSSMPPEVRGAADVRKFVWPKVVDYVRLRLELAAQATCDALVDELRLSPEEVNEAIGAAASRGAAPQQVAVEQTQRVDGALPGVIEKLLALEQRVAVLEAKFDTSDV